MAEKKTDSEIYTEKELKLFPERKSEGYKPSFWRKLFQSRNDSYYDAICQYKIRNAFKNNPLIKVLVSALKKEGCDINLRRHIVCENCDPKILGGYDSEFNQVVVCKGTLELQFDLDMILIHELIHMYDKCANEADFRNNDHLACTEIRAMNLTDCNFLHSFKAGQTSATNIKKTQEYCVKFKAASSMVTGRNIDLFTAAKHVNKVFGKCYNDLEPFGRRIRRNKPDADLAKKETEHFRLYE